MNTNLLSGALKRVFGNGSVNNISQSSLVPYCNASGVPDGLSSIINLASVLASSARANLGNFNDMKDWGVWQILDAQDKSNAPTGASGSGFMLVYGWHYTSQKRSVQMLVIQNNKIYVRCYNGQAWNEWREI